MSYGVYVFYDTSKLSVDEKERLLRDCAEICYVWRADTLDCSVSYSRRRYDCSFEEILEHLNEDAHFVVVDRGTWGGAYLEPKEHFEIAFRSMEPIDYFLTIEVESGKMPPILNKYHLAPKGNAADK